MHAVAEFSRHIVSLCKRLGHADRHAGLGKYRTGLMLWRRSVEAMSARLDLLHVSARHQALHYFTSKSEWSGCAVHDAAHQKAARARAGARVALDRERHGREKERLSVGARPY